ncbi:ATP-binding cassette domain-containing protein [Vagococcus fluvialis]|uniref:ATP-binding cassette domain-containing protein n=1 Tax=Vagococcus fluvialis TaxID=2738 RepID=UPI002033D672|nr:ABC transporter ATP-binding protein [Vagococcus fluvialis]MCM2138661.1 ABC transporter ATP-binding protein [Vagococcus fluvialis]MDT2780353.1 ABC transporter ATP-binding protein [Vagococcus fluvialis]WNF90979.1 ABC transporter ATP-binding protein [Vagococcus fluvialis]
MTLEIKHISKSYHKHNVLSDITFKIVPNKIYGLLGRNGAGKSTLLNIINNRTFASKGEVLLNGISMVDNEILLNQVYLMSEDNLFPPTMKVKEMFLTSEKFYGQFDWDLANNMVREFDLNQKLTLKKLSTGYRSIAKLIVSLCVPCDYVFLDEPVLGLDAIHRELFYRFLIETYEERQRTFVISTHLIEEITNLLEEVIIIDNGRLKVASDVDSLSLKSFSLSGSKDDMREIVQHLNIIGHESLGDFITVYISDELPVNLPNSITVKSLKLQDYFVQLTKRK